MPCSNTRRSMTPRSLAKRSLTAATWALTVRAQVVVMEDVDDDDVRVYLVMHDENGWVARMQAQHYAEVMAQEEGGTYEH